MNIMIKKSVVRLLVVAIAFLFIGFRAFAEDKVYPDKPNPERLVNDFGHVLNEGQVADLERKLDDFAQNTSTQITIVTIANLGGHDISEYSVHLFNTWGLGQAGKNNGVLILLTLDDGYGKKRVWTTVGKGLQGVLTDAKTGQIFRNEMLPAFKANDYYTGLAKGADAVIAVTKDEYKADGSEPKKSKKSGKGFIIVIIIFGVMIFASRSNKRGGGGGGGGGFGDLATGLLLGSMLSGGRGGNGGGWGGGNSGGGFGGFGGGSTDGGGAGGSWD